MPDFMAFSGLSGKGFTSMGYSGFVMLRLKVRNTKNLAAMSQKMCAVLFHEDIMLEPRGSSLTEITVSSQGNGLGAQNLSSLDVSLPANGKIR